MRIKQGLLEVNIKEFLHPYLCVQLLCSSFVIIQCFLVSFPSFSPTFKIVQESKQTNLFIVICIL